MPEPWLLQNMPLRSNAIFKMQEWYRREFPDGVEDIDLRNYGRYINITFTRENNITTGKICQHIIERERKGDYLGRTVQAVPHLTDTVQDWIEGVAKIPVDDTNERPDVYIIELGSTIGDVESAPFI
jgi:CTP synthase